MNKLHLLLLISTLLISGFTFAQDDEDDKNIVQNPGFESTDGKLKRQKQIEVAKYWSSSTGLAADLFSSSLKGDVPIAAPKNFAGTEKPLEGNNYAGVYMYVYNAKAPRTYITTELLAPLKKGMDYCISYSVSLADLSKYAVNNLGAYMSKSMKELEKEGKVDIVLKEDDLENVILYPENKVFNQQYNWEKICGVYSASGGEKYLTIGNFFPQRGTKFEKMKLPPGMKGTQQPVAYYYIDEVKVFLLDSIEECQCNKKSHDVRTKYVYTKQYISEKEFAPEEKVAHSTIYFDYLKPKLEPSYVKDLERIVEVMNANPDAKLEIHSHSDSEEFEYAKKSPANADLAKRRADKVAEYLSEKGISKTRLIIKVFDADKPATGGTTEFDMAKSRRVEFKLVK